MCVVEGSEINADDFRLVMVNFGEKAERHLGFYTLKAAHNRGGDVTVVNAHQLASGFFLIWSQGFNQKDKSFVLIKASGAWLQIHIRAVKCSSLLHKILSVKQVKRPISMFNLCS